MPVLYNGIAKDIECESYKKGYLFNPGWQPSGRFAMDLHDPDECENLAFKSCHESVIPGTQQVWSLTQFYSVDFSTSRIDVKKCAFNKLTINHSRFASAVLNCVLGTVRLARHT